MIAPAPPYDLTYAVGDLHGRLDLLEEALAAIERHAGRRRRRTVFLGDYVDRGPDSRGVVERLAPLQAAGDVVCLKGNHEDMLVKSYVDRRRRDFRQWIVCGAQATLTSYGGQGDEASLDLIPAEHVRWMAGLPLTTADPARLYVHAGIAPRRDWRDQDAATLLWIREAFLRAPAKDFDLHVVHGHTPRWEGKPDAATPERLPHRTNLDTGAYATGVLAIGVFEHEAAGGPRELLTIAGVPDPVQAAG